MIPRKHSFRRLGMGAVFLIAAVVAVGLAVVIALVGMEIAGGAQAYHRWLSAATPYFLAWRIALYIGLGGLYIGYWRPRLVAAQSRQADGGAAAQARLKSIERMLILVLVVIEASNLPAVVHWFAG